MTSIKPHNIPGEASADAGIVILDGPDGVALTMTPDAARRTGERLIAAADAAERGEADPE